jgi:hypothetical protein
MQIIITKDEISIIKKALGYFKANVDEYMDFMEESIDEPLLDILYDRFADLNMMEDKGILS